MTDSAKHFQQTAPVPGHPVYVYSNTTITAVSAGRPGSPTHSLGTGLERAELPPVSREREEEEEERESFLLSQKGGSRERQERTEKRFKREK